MAQGASGWLWVPLSGVEGAARAIWRFVARYACSARIHVHGEFQREGAKQHVISHVTHHALASVRPPGTRRCADMLKRAV
eukprot:364472-Chlamydomonas_euryale.AAC.3